MKTPAILGIGCVCLAVTAIADEIVLFDAATTPMNAVASQSGAKFQLRDGLVEIETKGETGYPGIRVKGTWDLSNCNRLTLELALRDRKGELPVTVRLDNPNAGGQPEHMFVDRVKIRGKKPASYTVALPPPLPYGREINSKLTGMKRGPFATTGVASDLDASKVVGVAVYIKEPKLDWLWGVKRIVAHTGPPPQVPDWMKLPPEKFFPFVDEYGQFKHKEWPGKTHTDGDLKKAMERERTDLAAHPGPEGWNKYGGWAKGPRQKATGRFRVEKINGKWWMVDPEGCLWWSHGPVRVTTSSAVTPLDGREFYFTDLPKADSPFALFYTTRDALLWPYYEARGIQRTYDFSSANACRKYGADWRARYSDLAHQRLRSWGMNTIANSSDKGICLQRRTPYCDRFELKSPDIEGAHLGWWKFKDPFHPEFRANFRRQLVQRKEELDDPWCFGFFVDNEISWGGETALADWTLQSPATQPAKIEMIRRLKEKYGSIAKLNDAWKTNYSDWDALLQSQQKPPPGAKDDCIAFTAVVTEAYFKNIRDQFKAVAPNTLYMGCRFAGSTKAAVQIGAKYCDVVSYNLYRHTLDDFKLPEGVDKPVMIGEFHFGALDRGMFHPSLIEVADQAARGKAYATYIASALRHPNFIGAHWHQFGEQPTTGRFDGENLQNGFLDVCDTPYPETIAGIREVGYRLYEIRSKGKE
ncbi:MAG: beta-galactosidase [Verrucomicrobia bacterium]|nr:beta-galactosidase [Verrucomicrobiota bacterium]